MKKALIIASVASAIEQFNMPNIKLLNDLGYEVHIACNFIFGNNCSEEKIKRLKTDLKGMQVSVFQVDFSRKIIELQKNMLAYKQVKKILSQNCYDLIHCHTPIPAALVRIAARKARKNGTKVIYTAHGFHFYKGAPLKNWLMYYPVEKLCAHFTDILININKEDYELAKHKLKAKQIEYVPGVGIDTKKFSDCTVDRAEKRKELGIPENATLLVSVGELNRNKNHEVVIKALAKLNNPNIYYLIAGKGNLEGYLNDLIKNLNLENNIRLLGYRTDIAELYKAADIYCHPSLREGLPVSVIEAMSSGKPIISSNARGNIDLCQNNINGLVCSPFSSDEFSSAISTLNANPELCEKYGNINKSKANDFDISIINKIMNEIYQSVDKPQILFLRR